MRFASALASVAVVLAALLHFASGEDGKGIGPGPSSPVESEVRASVDMSPIPRGVERHPARIPAADGAPPTSVQEQPVPEEAAPEEFGRIVGRVFGFDGEPLPDRHVVFTDGIDLFEGRKQVFAYSDRDGFYQVERASTGLWHAALHTTSPRVPEEMLRDVGQVRVHADETSHFDIVLHGERTLSGTVVLNLEEMDPSERGGPMLALELRRKFRPEEVAARGASVNHGLAPWEERGDPSLLDWFAEPIGDSDEPEEDRPLERGAFCFEGLEAEPYLLRIRLNADHWIDREVDLTLGDVELAPAELTLEEFVEARIEREKDR